VEKPVEAALTAEGIWWPTSLKKSRGGEEVLPTWEGKKGRWGKK
jgi:hypothetical protein